MLADQLKRRYGGGYLLPIVCFGYGILFIFVGSAGATEGYIYGSLYLLSVALYLHAARPQTYKVSARTFKGERGAGQLLVSAASPVPYHYIRNYLMK
ncbi:MAG: hypothetical protein Q8Q52_01900 [Acidimicrobiia bacterium]|nr:hypothetical protein [Acidimicrobiia bacterium]